MKKTVSVLICILFALTVLYPTGVIVAACFGYVFEVFSVSAFALVLAALSLFLVVSVVVCKPMIDHRAVSVLCAVTAPLSLVNVVVCLVTSPRIWVLVGGLVYVTCCCVLVSRVENRVVLKTLSVGLTIMTTVPIVSVGWVLFAAGFATTDNEVVMQTVPSPGGGYYAEVIERDQGALGGNTVVDVHEKSICNLLVFHIEKKPESVYYGRLGAYKDMEIYWKNENCLVINGMEEPIG